MELIDRQKAIDALIGLTAYKTKREIVEQCEKRVADENGWLGGVAECLDEIEDMQEEPKEGLAWKEVNLLLAELWAKSTLITDAEGLQHEVVHWADVKDELYSFYDKLKG